MVWAVVASDVNKSRLVFNDEGLEVNRKVFLIMLQNKILPWLSVRRSWTESGGWRDKQMWTPSNLYINPMDLLSDLL